MKLVLEPRRNEQYGCLSLFLVVPFTHRAHDTPRAWNSRIPQCEGDESEGIW